MAKILDVLLHDSQAGQLLQKDDGRLSFSYEAAYLKLPAAMPLSLGMPLAGSSYEHGICHAVFGGMLPEAVSKTIPVSQREFRLATGERTIPDATIDVAVQKAQARGVPAEVWDASTDQFPDTFDYVIIADCMEHVPMPEQLIERVRTRFRKALLISIPNSCYWRYRARVLFGKFMVQWVAHPGEHLRFWSIADMYWWLGQHHFRIERAYPTWGIPVLKHIWPSMFAQNVIYVVHDDTTRAA